MKKQLLTVAAAALMLTVAGTAQAQNDRKGFIGIGLGASIPTGDFADNDLNNEDAGLAKTGALFDINFGYKFSDVVGGMLLFRSQANKTDLDPIGKELAAELPAGTPFTIESDPIATASILVGPFVSFPLSDANKIAFESRALIGYSSTREPELTFKAGSYEYKSESVTGGSFAWLIGTGLRFNVSDRFGLGLHVDYFSAKPEFEHEEKNAGGATVTETYKQPVTTINTTLSLGYRFN